MALALARRVRQVPVPLQARAELWAPKAIGEHRRVVVAAVRLAGGPCQRVLQVGLFENQLSAAGVAAALQHEDGRWSLPRLASASLPDCGGPLSWAKSFFSLSLFRGYCFFDASNGMSDVMISPSVFLV